ncbi:stage III sporulation protein AB [Dysosmobacter sp.]|uniref:stage III sporulation protein AB n=1 Tax=Dysosmobacter sp. TaxID=2591382 RepID=UPI002A87CFD9|nr:stage III sporulation protein AB [Dysosmobacter sp.]MDY3282630.1 stage III sporulation protein AB [Dysosmobacter sp.]
MLKLLGSLCVFAAAGWAGGMQLRRGRRRLALLRGLSAALEQMTGEIRLNRTPMLRLLGQLAQRRGGEAAFFRTVRADVKNGTDLPAAWRSAARSLEVSEEVRAALEELGERLTGDEEQACRGLSQACDTVRKAAEELRRRQPDTERRNAVLWASGAAMLVILLI